MPNQIIFLQDQDTQAIQGALTCQTSNLLDEQLIVPLQLVSNHTNYIHLIRTIELSFGAIATTVGTFASMSSGTN
eukprot:8367771-Ditylum_brightwellii.AAC.1